ncbi:DUF5821 family protein [Halobaculum sp. MBLA0147]|uniref:transcriptional regulator TbsP domain-containing protein n=1 Tax=Halobaculum sp. MBLA0147 TaxID=3079934 RepID=UPI003523DFFA
MVNTTTADTPADALDSILQETSAEATLVTTSTDVLAGLADGLASPRHDGENLTVISIPSALKDVRDDYIIAGKLADSGVTLRAAEGDLSNYLVDDTHIWTLIPTASTTVVTRADETTADHVREITDTIAQDSEEFSLRTAGHAELIDDLQSEAADETAKYFDAALKYLDTVPSGRGSKMNEIVLLIAAGVAANEQLFTVGKAAENTQLGSRATVSRTKGDLEDNGLITTEKVPTDVGRPRLRLLPPEETEITSEADFKDYLDDLKAALQ